MITSNQDDTLESILEKIQTPDNLKEKLQVYTMYRMTHTNSINQINMFIQLRDPKLWKEIKKYCYPSFLDKIKKTLNKYPWVNPSTGLEPETGDEFLYVFFTHKNEPDKTYLCMSPTTTHPIKKHPLGFMGLVSIVLIPFLGESLSFWFGLILFFSLITGSIISVFTYTVYYNKVRKWKRQVILDWKSNKLRYKSSECTLSDFTFKLGGSPIDEKVFF